MIARTFLNNLRLFSTITFYSTESFALIGSVGKERIVTVFGLFVNNETGMAGVVVGNSHETTYTDRLGSYHLIINPESDFVFISILVGYKITNTKGNKIEHNHIDVRGIWWVGDICTDGALLGYGVYQVDGDNIGWYIEPTKGEKSNQLHIYPLVTSTNRPNEIIANGWSWHPVSKAEWIEDELSKERWQNLLAYINMYGVNFPSLNGSI